MESLMQMPTEMAFITLVVYKKQRRRYRVHFAGCVKGKTDPISHPRFYFHEYDGGQ